jgi:hypothetical protein
VWTKYGKPKLYVNREIDLITKTLHLFKSVNRENEVKKSGNQASGSLYFTSFSRSTDLNLQQVFVIIGSYIDH